MLGNASVTTSYLCPGERHPISRAVHLGRLAAVYSKCRDCPHRTETGFLPNSLATLPRSRPVTAEPVRLRTEDGFRGRYLNDMTRRDAERWAAALAIALWDRTPLTGTLATSERVASAGPEAGGTIPEPASGIGAGSREPTAMSRWRTGTRSGPVVVLGCDERLSSADLALGVATGLQYRGCQVLDLGRVRKPAWQITAAELSAAAGVFVTGQGCDPAWTGLDFVREQGRPALWEDWLADLLDLTQQPLGRPTRVPGTMTPWLDESRDAARLSAEFHALRPLRLVIGSGSRLTRQLVETLLVGRPCPLRCVATPWGGGETTAFERVRAAAVEHQADLAVWIADDDQRLVVFDERRERVADEVWQRPLWRALEAEDQGRPLAVLTDRSSRRPLPDRPLPIRLAATSCGLSSDGVSKESAHRDEPGGAAPPGASLSAFLKELSTTPHCAGGVDPQGRVWLNVQSEREPGLRQPMCDAVRTIAVLLRGLSWSDCPLSAWGGSTC